MPQQLPVDCLNEILEYLKEDRVTLKSCLLVNHLWCEISVRILWRNSLSFIYTVPMQYQLPDASSQILNTLIDCLPNESKDILNKNGIFIATPSWKPLFNYASFCKILSIRDIDLIIHYALDEQHSTTFDDKYLILQEILKMFMKQISSLESLHYNLGISRAAQNVLFTCFPGAKRLFGQYISI